MQTNNPILFSVFTKPWKTQSIPELAEFVRSVGFDAIEFPLRDGYQVEPSSAERDLPRLANKLAEYGLKIASVASETSESVFAACAEAGVPIIRIMCGADLSRGYLACEAEWKHKLESLLPLTEKYGVKIGVQQHYGAGVFSTMELLHLIEGFDSRQIGGIWDAAHSGLSGEEPEQALDIAWSHLCMVNLKTAFYRPITGPEAEEARFERYFTTGRLGLCSWRRAVTYLTAHGYRGTVCLPAEYTDEVNTERYIRQDLAYAKQLFAECAEAEKEAK